MLIISNEISKKKEKGEKPIKYVTTKHAEWLIDTWLKSNYITIVKNINNEMPNSNIKFIPIQNKSVILHVWFVLFLVCLYICICECLLQNNNLQTKHKNNTNCGSAFEPGASGLPYYCVSICVRSWCNWRASSVDSKTNKKKIICQTPRQLSFSNSKREGRSLRKNTGCVFAGLSKVAKRGTCHGRWKINLSRFSIPFILIHWNWSGQIDSQSQSMVKGRLTKYYGSNQSTP